VHIENGQVTGREVGGPSTNLGMEAIRTADPNPDRFNYRTRTKDGRVLRSSSVYFRDTEGALIAALCINFDVMAYAEANEALEELLGSLPGESAEEVPEIFGGDIGEVLDGLVQEAIARTGRTPASMDRDEKVEVLRWLDLQGAFLVKRAIDRVSKALRISRVTAYAYLREARETQLSRPSGRRRRERGRITAEPRSLPG
jgi:predicted transcriptional regulator YheO